jgi:quercetin dioxygenase-like cupin family protein
MKAAQMITVLMAVSGLVMHVAQAQQPGTKRTDLQRHDLSIPGREAIQVRVDIGPGEVAPKHTRAKRSFMSSKAHWNMRSRASRR